MITECPECGNGSLRRIAEEVHIREYSAKTGDLLKDRGCTVTNCWSYSCPCGWESYQITAE